MRAPFSIVASGVTLRPASGRDIWGQWKPQNAKTRVSFGPKYPGVNGAEGDRGAEPLAPLLPSPQDTSA